MRKLAARPATWAKNAVEIVDRFLSPNTAAPQEFGHAVTQDLNTARCEPESGYHAAHVNLANAGRAGAE